MFDSFEKYKKWTTLLGGILIHVSLGSINTFPILSPYLTSYLREITGSNVRYSTSGWISTATSLTLTVTSFFTGMFITKYRPNLKAVIFIGCIIYWFDFIILLEFNSSNF